MRMDNVVKLKFNFYPYMYSLGIILFIIILNFQLVFFNLKFKDDLKFLSSKFFFQILKMHTVNAI